MLDLARDPTPREAATLLTRVFAARLAVGVVLTAAPRWSWRRLTWRHRPGDDAVLAVRMLGLRDVALGLGGLLAARHDGAVRGWAEAGVLADAGDAVAVAAGSAVVGWRRPVAALAAAGSAASGLVAARALGDAGGADDADG